MNLNSKEADSSIGASSLEKLLQSGMLNLTSNATVEERHTEQIEEIITRIPSWIVRWGITILFGIFLSTLLISVLISYPDTIHAELKLNQTVLTQKVISPGAVLVTRVFVKRGSKIKNGEPLIVVQHISSEHLDTIKAFHTGRVAFSSIIQPGSILKDGQELLNIHPENEHFFGTIEIFPKDVTQIRPGQIVQISLRNYPVEEYGRLKGIVSELTDEPNEHGFFTAKIILNESELKKKIDLRSWMTVDVKLFTKNINLLNRLYTGVFKSRSRRVINGS